VWAKARKSPRQRGTVGDRLSAATRGRSVLAHHSGARTHRAGDPRAVNRLPGHRERDLRSLRNEGHRQIVPRRGCSDCIHRARRTDRSSPRPGVELPVAALVLPREFPFHSVPVASATLGLGSAAMVGRVDGSVGRRAELKRHDSRNPQDRYIETVPRDLTQIRTLRRLQATLGRPSMRWHMALAVTPSRFGGSSHGHASERDGRTGTLKAGTTSRKSRPDALAIPWSVIVVDRSAIQRFSIFGLSASTRSSRLSSRGALDGGALDGGALDRGAIHDFGTPQRA